MTGLSRDALKKLRAEREKLLRDDKPEDVAKAFEQLGKKVPAEAPEKEEYNPFKENEFRSFDPTSSGKKGSSPDTSS